MATSRKQSGRRPLKILLRIVCHFTSERSRSGRNGPRSHPRAASQREQTSVFTDSFGVTCDAHMHRRDSVQSALLLSPGSPLAPDLSEIHEMPPLAPIIPWDPEELTVLLRLG